MCITSAWSVRQTSGAVLLFELQACFIYYNINEMPLHPIQDEPVFPKLLQLSAAVPGLSFYVNALCVWEELLS